MKMATRFLFRRAAGMENCGAFDRSKTGQFQFLERSGRHGGNLGPMLDNLRCQFVPFANFSISRIIFELKREKFKRERFKLFVLKAGSNGIAQARGEI